jgi:hypothetical protein
MTLSGFLSFGQQRLLSSRDTARLSEPGKPAASEDKHVFPGQAIKCCLCAWLAWFKPCRTYRSKLCVSIAGEWSCCVGLKHIGCRLSVNATKYVLVRYAAGQKDRVLCKIAWGLPVKRPARERDLWGCFMTGMQAISGGIPTHRRRYVSGASLL